MQAQSVVVLDSGDDRDKGMFDAVAIPVVLGVLFACSSNAAVKGRIPVREAAFYLDILCYALLFSLVFMLADALVRLNHPPLFPSLRLSPKLRRTHKLMTFSHAQNLRGVLPDAGRICCCWLPYIVLLYPVSLSTPGYSGPLRYMFYTIFLFPIVLGLLSAQFSPSPNRRSDQSMHPDSFIRK
ncbi:hypothetical protein BACT_1228 [Bifidobacterium actinocoloniiforme DSM 22766]|uniref:Uncharacterized protein n=1 Tax=Bifidobacterium actinocoloniiforme DSM 22766 TaxID=1437605 RepID=A0A086Z1X4_9BIFI|nr:hypothetical protein AB656_04770 [Bifidobacterium actinocoloniiforme DSM 22766]KFI40524.1 hypothetical protein BACT_1228 [Bifidobacterium actinocoloniiforme DSM 22766]